MAIDFNDMTPVGGLVRPPKKKPRKKPSVIGGLIDPKNIPSKKPPIVLSGMVKPPKTEPPKLSPEDAAKAKEVFLQLLNGMSKTEMKQAIAAKNASEAYN